MTRSRHAVLLSLIGTLLSAGCSNNTGPAAGALNVSLFSPQPDDGAVLLSVWGGPVDSVESIGFSVYSVKAPSDTVKLIVAGDLGSGTLARIHIPDIRRASNYTAHLSQVTARETYVLRDPNQYAVALSP